MSSFLTELSKQRTVVLGGGVTGKSLREFLATHSLSVTVIDEKKSDQGEVAELTEELASRFDLAIVSPGWRVDHPFVQRLKKHNVAILSEIDFAWQVKNEVAPHQRWIGLTGTNGKTTTIQMVESIFSHGQINGTACGNVGDTVIEAVMHQPAYDYLALELSSFQLEWSSMARYEAGAILNIAEDHIDWHGSFENYSQSKLKLLSASKIAIVNGDDVSTMNSVKALSGRTPVYFTLNTPARGSVGLVENLLIDRAFVGEGDAEVLSELSDIQPAVPHNVANALAAGALCRAIGISSEVVQRGIKNFTLDHHRLEKVLVHDEITWINDSKATNPHAALAALHSQIKTIWIAGGLAKGASMTELIQRGHSRIKAAILIGTDAQIIESELQKYAPSIPIYRVGEDGSLKGEALMEKVVTQAKVLASAGDSVLLAPACASMDQFTSYADRGNSFAQAVRKLVSNA